MKRGDSASDCGDPNDLDRFLSAQERIFDLTLFAALKNRLLASQANTL
jgi:hypothetical protein